MEIQQFTFGPFQENTYLLYDSSKECAIVDPGCFDSEEQTELKNFIDARQLKLVLLLNTHCHLDHIAGNRFVYDQYNLLPLLHELDLPILNMQEQSSHLYGLPCDKSPQPQRFLIAGEKISFGRTKLEVLFAPGHSPGHVVFYHKEKQMVISGDVLFSGSIGRTDLPGGNYDTLIQSIKNTIFPLGDDVIVYSGHGPQTSIGAEKRSNPFLQ